MAPQIQKAGVSTIKVNTGAGLEILGYSMDQVEEREQAFYSDVPGDAHGGPAGPPIEVQYMGRVVHVRLNLSKWDKTVAGAIRERVTSGNAEGNVINSEIGTLMFQDQKFMTVFVSNANDPRYYTRCICREPIEVARGTKWGSLILEFEAHRSQTTGQIHTTAT